MLNSLFVLLLSFSFPVKDEYFETASKTIEGKCHVLKRLGGTWLNKCGFGDGEKLICMDGLYSAVKNQTCLVYSFGLADDWDFEIFMAQMGCTVRAFDPSSVTQR